MLFALFTNDIGIAKSSNFADDTRLALQQHRPVTLQPTNVNITYITRTGGSKSIAKETNAIHFLPPRKLSNLNSMETTDLVPRLNYKHHIEH